MNEINNEAFLIKNLKKLSEYSEKTNRARTREKEDLSFIPVILKRSDQAIRHPDDILENTIKEGEEQHHRSVISLLLSSMSAGMILGFAAMCVSLASLIFTKDQPFIYDRLALALVYPLGFVVCVLSGTQLFTEHTATAVYPVLDKKSTVKSLLRVWAIVLIGNLIGTFVSSFLISLSNRIITSGAGFLEIAMHFSSFSFGETFGSAILAGWLMAQGGWLVYSTPPGSGQIISIYIVTFIIGLGGLHHSIVGSAELFSSMLINGQPSVGAATSTLIAAILGNTVGGSLFVASLNYAHIKKTQKVNQTNQKR